VQACSHYPQAFALNQPIGNRILEAYNRTGLGNVAQKQADDEQARSYYEQALAVFDASVVRLF